MFGLRGIAYVFPTRWPAPGKSTGAPGAQEAIPAGSWELVDREDFLQEALSELGLEEGELAKSRSKHSSWAKLCGATVGESMVFMEF